MRPLRRHHASASCAAATALAVIGLGAQTPPEPTRIDVRETVLARFDPGADRKSVTIDRRTGRRVAWVSKAGRVARVVVDGRPGPDFDEVKFPPSVFSDDSQHVAHSGKRKKQWFVVVDGREHGPYHRVVTGIPVAFSADGQRMGWAARRSDGLVVVIDGTEQGPFDGAAVPVFSRDGRRVAYQAMTTRGRKFVARMVVDGQQGPEFAAIGRPHFSADGLHLAYWARRDDEKMLTLVVDGKAVATSDRADTVWPLSESDPLDEFMVANGLPFTPDAEHLSYLTFDKKRAVIVVNGKRGPSSQWYSQLTFTPDRGRFAYAVADEQGFSKALGAVAGMFGAGRTHHPILKAALVVDGELRVALPEPTGMPRFSPDGVRLAYPSKNAVVVDGAPGQRYDEIAPDSLAWSPDGRRLAFAAKRDNRWFVVVDGVEGPAFTGITALRPFGSSTGLAFTPDGRHLIHGAVRGGTMSVVVHPALEAPGYSLLSDILVFETPGTFAFAALRGDEIVRVEVDLPEQASPFRASAIAPSSVSRSRLSPVR